MVLNPKYSKNTMIEPTSTFISFRRIRYHEASFVYRDLMLSGALPWLSDHCITSHQALHFLKHPSQLGPFLSDAIAESGCSLVLIDEGYFHSPWTRFEFENLIEKGSMIVIVLLDNAELPTTISNQLSGAFQCHVYTDLREGLNAVCKHLGIKLVPFTGRRIYECMPTQAFDFEFNRPIWLTEDISHNRWFSHYGDELWLRVSPILNNDHTKPILSLLEDTSQTNAEKLYELIEDELWYQARRLSLNERDESPLLTGYHKLHVPGLHSTAVALSLRDKWNTGFCRYAAIIAPELGLKLQIVCFVKGSLQRFFTLIPDIDEMIVTLEKKGNLIQNQKPQGSTENFNIDTIDDFVWARCVKCKQRVSSTDISMGHCKNCKDERLECMTVHCDKPKQMKFKELEAVTTSEREGTRKHVSEPNSYSLSPLCEGCLSCMFIPGQMVSQLNLRPHQGMPVIWNDQIMFLLWWAAICVYGIVWGGGTIYRIVLGIISILEVAEILENKTRTNLLTPATKKRFYFLNFLSLIVCYLWIGANSGILTDILSTPILSLVGSPVMLGLAGCLIVLNMGLRSVDLFSRFVESHLIFTAVYASLYSFILTWKFNILKEASGLVPTTIIIGFSLIITIGAVIIICYSKFVKRFTPDDLWE